MFCLDYDRESVPGRWWLLMLVSWLVALPCAQLTVGLLVSGDNRHFMEHHFLNRLLRPRYGCRLCSLDSGLMEVGRRLQEDEANKLQTALRKSKAQEKVQPILSEIIGKFNVAFMEILPEWEHEIENSGLPEYKHSGGWDRRCTNLLRTIITDDVQFSEICKDCPAEWIAEMMDFPNYGDWFAYVEKWTGHAGGFSYLPNPEGKAIRDKQKPRLARVKEPRHFLGYEGEDRNDSAIITRTFAWFAEEATNTFTLTLPRNADRLSATDVGSPLVFDRDWTRCSLLFMVLSECGISAWPPIREGETFKLVGRFNDGFDELYCFRSVLTKVMPESCEIDDDFVRSRIMSSIAECGFSDVQVYARRIPEPDGTECFRATDVVMRKTISGTSQLKTELDETREWCRGWVHVGLHSLRKALPAGCDGRDRIIILENNRNAAFIHWERLEGSAGTDERFAVYLILTDKWGYKGGVNRRDHKDYGRGLACRLLQRAKEGKR